MVAKELLFIKYNEIELEAEIWESKTDNKSIIIVCHPHPQIN